MAESELVLPPLAPFASGGLNTKSPGLMDFSSFISRKKLRLTPYLVMPECRNKRHKRPLLRTRKASVKYRTHGGGPTRIFVREGEGKRGGFLRPSTFHLCNFTTIWLAKAHHVEREGKVLQKRLTYLHGKGHGNQRDEKQN